MCKKDEECEKHKEPNYSFNDDLAVKKSDYGARDKVCFCRSDESFGVKYDSDKLRYDLLPVRPMEKVAYVYTMGAKKYADRNWEKGLKWGRVFGAMLRHAWRWWNGETYDKEDGQHHLASVVWCALALMEYEETHSELDDRSKLKRGTIVNKCTTPNKSCVKREKTDEING